MVSMVSLRKKIVVEKYLEVTLNFVMNKSINSVIPALPCGILDLDLTKLRKLLGYSMISSYESVILDTLFVLHIMIKVAIDAI